MAAACKYGAISSWRGNCRVEGAAKLECAERSLCPHSRAAHAQFPISSTSPGRSRSLVESGSAAFVSALFFKDDLDVAGVRSGPTRESSAGRKISPCPQPSTTMATKQTKTVRITSLVLRAKGRTPKSVDKPPLRTAAPIVCKVSFVFSSLVSNLEDS